MKTASVEIDPILRQAALRAETLFARHGVHLTLGGEPTYVPENPLGAEWNHSAVGPEKLSYAQRLAASLIKNSLPTGTAFYSPGKQYPGETNPRWALRILFPAEDWAEHPLHQPHGELVSPGVKELPALTTLTRQLARYLGLALDWARFSDPTDSEKEVRAILLDHDESAGWVATPWKLPPSQLRLLPAEGPAGLRLPLQLLPPAVVRRSLTLERSGSSLSVFFPPLLERPFLALLEFFRRHLPRGAAAETAGVSIHYQGYLPPKLSSAWSVLGIASDPGVLEINLPPCASWSEYAAWLTVLDRCARECGLRAWREDRGEWPGGTGGGNHFLFGSPPDKPNCFYDRPAWLASMLTYWQKHPALSYLFTGDYVGASSQAPRPDESGISLRELQLALEDLRDAKDPPIPYFIAENLRHLLVDSAGNPHRAEMSLDKFHDLNHPAGLLGLIEFRAIESLPEPRWSSAVALLWVAVAARLLECPDAGPLRPLGPKLHDRYFLPHFLWSDLQVILRDCRGVGCDLPRDIFREIWAWKFPTLLAAQENPAHLEVRKAHESWPLLAEMPDEGGLTSRFVDTSLRRLEFAAPAGWSAEWRASINDRPLPLHPAPGGLEIAGLRYRHANLYPALHPRRPVQLPLRLVLERKRDGRRVAAYILEAGSGRFLATAIPGKAKSPGAEVPPFFSGAYTRDLRWE